MAEVTTYTLKVKLKNSEREYLSCAAHFTHHSKKDHFFFTRYLGLPPLYEAPPDLYITPSQIFQNKRESRHRSVRVGWILKTF